MLECANQVLVTSTRLTGKTASRSLIAMSVLRVIPQRPTLRKSILCNGHQRGILAIMIEINERTSCAGISVSHPRLQQLCICEQHVHFRVGTHARKPCGEDPLKPRIRSNEVGHSATPAIGIRGSALALAADCPFLLESQMHWDDWRAEHMRRNCLSRRLAPPWN